MADPDDKIEENVAGKYYVDTSCIDCDVCRTTAPNNFEANEDERYSFVSKQPEGDEEIAQVDEGAPFAPLKDPGQAHRSDYIQILPALPRPVQEQQQRPSR